MILIMVPTAPSVPTVSCSRSQSAGSPCFMWSFWSCPCSTYWSWTWPLFSSVRPAVKSWASKSPCCCPSLSCCWFFRICCRPLRTGCQWSVSCLLATQASDQTWVSSSLISQSLRLRCSQLLRCDLCLGGDKCSGGHAGELLNWPWWLLCEENSKICECPRRDSFRSWPSCRWDFLFVFDFLCLRALCQ